MKSIKNFIAEFTQPPRQTPEDLAREQLYQARIEYLETVAREEEARVEAVCREAEANILTARIARLNEYLGNAEDGRPGH